MSVICVSSLKGGVGKTSVSLNLGHSFARRGCRTLLVDLDPAAHSSRYLCLMNGAKDRDKLARIPSPLAQLLLSNHLSTQNCSDGYDSCESLFDLAAESQLSLVETFRDDFDIVRGGPEVRNFHWGQGARQFSKYFQRFISECQDAYDYIILDTAPDLNVVSRNAIAGADMVLVPVDSSAMSIYSLEELVTDCGHIKGPVWSIVRTMVNKRASRIQRLTNERLNANAKVQEGGSDAPGLKGDDDFDVDEVEDFREVLKDYESESAIPNDPLAEKAQVEDPIYLLNSVIYRTEQQNRLSFLGATSLDKDNTKALAEQYLGLAREVEEIISLTSERVGDFQDNSMSDMMCFA